MAGQWKDIAKETRRAAAISRIARHVAWEQVSGAKPTDLSRVPPSPEALTVEYLTAVLCADHPGAKVTSLKLGAASSGSADRCAFSVAYNAAGNEANLPTRLFHKCTKSFYTRLHLLRCENSANSSKAVFSASMMPGRSIAVRHSTHSLDGWSPWVSGRFNLRCNRHRNRWKSSSAPRRRWTISEPFRNGRTKTWQWRS
jgi:hypothetical protein